MAPVADYTRTIVAGAAEKLDDLDDAIERHLSEDWELFRLPAVDRQILRVAAWEILFNDEVDAPVSIAEGVEMAAEYSGVDAAPYINVVLDGVAQHAASNAPFAGEEAEDAYAVDEDADTVGVFDAPEQDASVPSEAEDLGSDTAREIAESTEDLEAGEPAVDESRG